MSKYTQHITVSRLAISRAYENSDCHKEFVDYNIDQ